MSEIVASAKTLIQSDQSVSQRFAMEVHHAADGICRLSALIDAGWVNGAGFVHGSVAYALMDSACAYACASREVRGVTTNGNITYVRGGRGDTALTAQAQVISQSRRVMSLTARLEDEDKQLLAHGSFLFQLI